MAKIDARFPVRTDRMNGHKPVTLISGAGPKAGFPFVGFVKDEDALVEWDENGKPLLSYQVSIENTPIVEEVWVIVFSNGSTVTYHSETQVRTMLVSTRKDVVAVHKQEIQIKLGKFDTDLPKVEDELTAIVADMAFPPSEHSASCLSAGGGTSDDDCICGAEKK